MTSTFVSCSEDRVALARRGALSPTEWQDFATHLTVCLDCRVAWRLAIDFEHDGEARPGDERVVARAVKAALASSARPRAHVLRFAVAASLILLVAGAASAAIVLRVRHREAAGPNLLPSHPRPPKPRADRGRVVVPQAPAEAPPASAIERPAEAPIPIPAAASPRHLVTAPALPRPEPAQTPPLAGPRELPGADPFDDDRGPLSPAPPPGMDAPALLARAMAERRDGRIDAAIATFRQLQRELPDSSEATVSLVSLGHLLLADGRPAEALRELESYLRRAPRGALVPEAWVGKARALDAMGRTTEASAAWDEIGKRFPDHGYLRP
jgi:TolA-binding protein